MALRNDPDTKDFDSAAFIRKMRGGDEGPSRLVNPDDQYRATDLGRMIKTVLISLEILAERINEAK